MTTATRDKDRTPVAQDIMTLCTKEKIDTWHVVMNHDASGIVDRVKCKACGSEHKYRRIKVAAPWASKSSPRSTTKSSVSASLSGSQLQELWFKGIKAWGNKDPLKYDPAQRFEKAQVIEHPTFGKGLVQLRRENRIDVLFSSGLKVLPSRSS